MSEQTFERQGNFINYLWPCNTPLNLVLYNNHDHVHESVVGLGDSSVCFSWSPLQLNVQEGFIPMFGSWCWSTSAPVTRFFQLALLAV